MTHISEIDATNMLAHGADWHASRALGIGGSDACAIMRGVPEELEALRLQKLGRGTSDDLTRVLPVQMGSWTEPLNRLWLSYAIKLPVMPGIACRSLIHKFMRANIDGVIGPIPADLLCDIVECKHVNDFVKLEGVHTRYFAQLQHNMAVSGAPSCYLSVFFGSGRHEYVKVERDEGYIASLIAREAEFWEHVSNDTPIVVAAPATAPTPLAKLREVDMKGSNSWAHYAHKWLKLREDAKQFADTVAELRDLLPLDARRAFGDGIEVVRDKRGVIVRELKKPQKFYSSNKETT